MFRKGLRRRPWGNTHAPHGSPLAPLICVANSPERHRSIRASLAFCQAPGFWLSDFRPGERPLFSGRGRRRGRHHTVAQPADQLRIHGPEPAPAARSAPRTPITSAMAASDSSAGGARLPATAKRRPAERASMDQPRSEPSVIQSSKVRPSLAQVSIRKPARASRDRRGEHRLDRGGAGAAVIGIGHGHDPRPQRRLPRRLDRGGDDRDDRGRTALASESQLQPGRRGARRQLHPGDGGPRRIGCSEVPERYAERRPGRHPRGDILQHSRRNRAERPGCGLLGVEDVGPTRHRRRDFVGGTEAHQQPHHRSLVRC